MFFNDFPRFASGFDSAALKWLFDSKNIKTQIQFTLLLSTWFNESLTFFQKQINITNTTQTLIQSFLWSHLQISTWNYFPPIGAALASCSGCSFTSVHIQSRLALLQVFLQRKASLSNTLASLWLRGWWNALRRSLVTGSIGPRFLSATRRVLDMGRLDSAASTLSDIGPAGRTRGWCQIYKRNPVGRNVAEISLCFFGFIF